jgi:triosephosphate isomerase
VVVKQNVMLPFYRLYKENQVNKKHHFIGSVVKKARQEKKILLWGGSVNKKSDFIGFTKNDVEK